MALSSTYRFDELVELDEATLMELAAAHAERWTQTEELLAVIAEISHSLLRVMLQAYGDQDTKVPDQLKVARPWDDPVQSKAVRFGDLVKQMASGK